MSPSYASYTTQLCNPTVQAVPGLPVYLYGSLARNVAPTKMRVTNSVLTSNVVTLTVTILEGQVPTTSQLITVTGCTNSAYTVSNAAITGVTQVNTPDNGVYTITYAVTHANIATAPDFGSAVAPQVEIGDTLVNGSSLAASIQSNTGPNNGRSVRVDVTFPSIGSITAVTVSVYTAEVDIDSAYQLLGVVSTVTTGTQTGSSVVYADLLANFIRFTVSSLTGTGTIVAKVTV